MVIIKEVPVGIERVCDGCEYPQEPIMATFLIRFKSGDSLNLCPDCLQQLHNAMTNYKEAQSHDNTPTA